MKEVFKNHNQIIEGIEEHKYNDGYIDMNVKQEKRKISITSYNRKTDRAIDLSAKKYAALFLEYESIGLLKSDKKTMIIILEELVSKVDVTP